MNLQKMINWETRKMKFCPKCGMKVEEGSKFCPKCGYKLTTTIINSKRENQNLNKAVKVEGEKYSLRQFKYTKWIAVAIIIIILGVVGYRQFYVPNVVKSALSSNNFTSAKGYTPTVDFSKHTIMLYANNDAQGQYMKELEDNEYDTRKIDVETQLSGLAHDISSKTLGTWQVAIAIKSDQGTTILWEYNGTKETKRFQTSSQGRQLREEYLEKQKEAEEQAQEEDRDEKIGAGLLGGGIGLLIGGL